MWKSVSGWLGNAGTTVYGWGKSGLEFAWSLPGYAAEQARVLGERQAAEHGKTIQQTQRAAAGQQAFLTGNLSMNNIIILALGVAVIVALVAKK